MSKIRVGIIGAGWVTQHHLDAYSRLEKELIVVAIADPDIEAAKTRAEQYGINDYFESAEHMLSSIPLDMVDIAAPREYHVDLCLLCDKYNIPILCQKPIAQTFSEAKLLEENLSNNATLMVHENWRFRPHYRTIKKYINNGSIGNPIQVQMSIFTSGLLKNEHGIYPALERQQSLKHLDRMLVMEVMIHHIDTLRFLFGDLRLVYKSLGKLCKKITGEDNASLIFQGNDGPTISLMGNFCAHGWPPQQRDNLTIIGEKGSIKLSGTNIEIITSSETISHNFDFESDYKDSYYLCIKHFIDNLKTISNGGESKFETSLEDNIKTLKLVESAYEKFSETSA